LTNIFMVLGPYNKSGTKGAKQHNLAFQSDSLRSRLKAALNANYNKTIWKNSPQTHDALSGGLFQLLTLKPFLYKSEKG